MHKSHLSFHDTPGKVLVPIMPDGTLLCSRYLIAHNDSMGGDGVPCSAILCSNQLPPGAGPQGMCLTESSLRFEPGLIKPL